MSKSEWVGGVLGGYLITEQIGTGSMAEVYKALQPSMNRMVAIKILSATFSGDPEFVTRFRQEARTAATLEHPHILPVIDFGDQHGTLYLVMRYVSGGTLHDLIRKGPLSPPVALRYLTEIGEALDYAHSKGVVHRDIKPKNVLLDAQGHPFIADFGLAKILTGGGITRSGLGIIGTPHYMSPEQGRGQPVDARSDIYSLGIVLYEMLTGRVPYDAESAVGIIMKHVTEPVPDITRLQPGLPPVFATLFARALAKEPSERYQSVHEFIEALARAIGTPVVSEARGIWTPLVERPEAGLGPEAGEIRHGTDSDFATVVRVFKRWLQLKLQNSRDRIALILDALNFTRERRRQALVMGTGVAVLALIAFSIYSAVTGAASVTPTTPITSPLSPTVVEATPFTATGQATASVVARATNTVAATLIPPTPTALPANMTVAPNDGMALAYIPAGNFLLGSADSDPNAEEDEKPQQITYLDAFWIDRTEVTVAQFQDFVNATGYVTQAEKGGGEGDYAKPGGIVFAPEAVFVRTANWKLPEGAGAPEALPRRPVVQVSWNDAKAYCEWAGRRLPTEAEWDKAARGTQGLIYPWGNDFEGTRVNFCDKSCPTTWHSNEFDDGFSRTANVGVFTKGASPYGVVDMSGNVWEWVNDWYDFRGYYRFPTASPPGAEFGTMRVTRGGSWIDSFDRVRVSARASLVPEGRNDVTGFRCAASVVP